jgi:hypothetical protein
MGFLTGAFGKISARMRVLDLQNQSARIQRDLRTTQKQIANKEKMLQRMQRQAEGGVRQQGMFHQMTAQGGYQKYMSDAMSNISITELAQRASAPGASEEAKREYEMAQSQQHQAQIQAQQMTTMYNQQAQMSMEQQKEQMAQWFDMMRDMELEPLKDMEKDLEMEKGLIESQQKLAEQEYEARVKEEQAEAKIMAPQYTSGG